jgi:hypothetical protein
MAGGLILRDGNSSQFAGHVRILGHLPRHICFCRIFWTEVKWLDYSTRVQIQDQFLDWRVKCNTVRHTDDMAGALSTS